MSAPDDYERSLIKLLGFVFRKDVELELSEAPKAHRCRMVGTTLVPQKTIQSWANRSWLSVEMDEDESRWARLTPTGQQVADSRWTK